MGKIESVKIGVTNCFLINVRSGYLLVDTGEPGKVRIFWNYIERKKIMPEEIKFIILTHAHYDHAGNCWEIREKTGAQLIVHREEILALKMGKTEIPKSMNMWGELYARLILISGFDYKPVEPDIVIDGDVDLNKYSIDGELVHTPGHTAGSISLILASGEAFVGDLIMSVRPFTDGMPLFAENKEQVLKSWRKLLEKGVRRIYPSHGKPLSADFLRRLLKKYTGS